MHLAHAYCLYMVTAHMLRYKPSSNDTDYSDDSFHTIPSSSRASLPCSPPSSIVSFVKHIQNNTLSTHAGEVAISAAAPVIASAKNEESRKVEPVAARKEQEETCNLASATPRRSAKRLPGWYSYGNDSGSDTEDASKRKRKLCESDSLDYPTKPSNGKKVCNCSNRHMRLLICSLSLSLLPIITVHVALRSGSMTLLRCISNTTPRQHLVKYSVHHPRRQRLPR